MSALFWSQESQQEPALWWDGSQPLVESQEGDEFDDMWWAEEQREAHEKIDAEEERVREENEAAARWGRERQKAEIERKEAMKKVALLDMTICGSWAMTMAEYELQQDELERMWEEDARRKEKEDCKRRQERFCKMIASVKFGSDPDSPLLKRAKVVIDLVDSP